MELTNSKRKLLTASYVERKLKEDERERVDKVASGGIQKSNLHRALSLSREDLPTLMEQVQKDQSEHRKHLDELMRFAKEWVTGQEHYSNLQ
ncbi:hypothetical protein [Paenibacillus anseongense]|uniref:hypothetical protein n=1 Tax=Paenibacillus anseongense TaxID=2682845 RepID=UPI002DBA28DA|nr:hypothetical protein [Paenibacillus anseongense]MEC0269596.1 hypothetical protein [Paenibacillus anseongense]